MNIKIGNLLLCFFIPGLCSFSMIYGQSNQPEKLYHVDIEKNIGNIRTVNLSSTGKEVSYIPLETTAECIIQQINKVLISDSYIFASEYNRLLQFDKTGKFIRQIGSHGRGPEEYLSVSDFCIDRENHLIYIISDKLSIFSFAGDFVKAVKLSFRPAQIILKDKNHLMFHLANVPGNYSMEHSWIITDRQGNIQQRFKNNLRRVSQPGLIIMYTPLYSFNNSVHFMEFGIDTLYSFQSGKKRPYVIFNFGDLKMEPDPLITSATKRRIAEESFKSFWINSVQENEEFMFLNLVRGITDSVMYSLFNKRTQEFLMVKENCILNDLDGGLPFWPKQILEDNLLVNYIDAYDFLKRFKALQPDFEKKDGKSFPVQLINLKNQLTETSNPVIMLVRSNK